MSGLHPKMQVRGRLTSVQYKDKLSDTDIHKFYILSDICIFTTEVTQQQQHDQGRASLVAQW